MRIGLNKPELNTALERRGTKQALHHGHIPEEEEKPLEVEAVHPERQKRQRQRDRGKPCKPPVPRQTAFFQQHCKGRHGAYKLPRRNEDKAEAVAIVVVPLHEGLLRRELENKLMQIVCHDEQKQQRRNCPQHNDVLRQAVIVALSDRQRNHERRGRQGEQREIVHIPEISRGGRHGKYHKSEGADKYPKHDEHRRAYHVFLHLLLLNTHFQGGAPRHKKT